MFLACVSNVSDGVITQKSGRTGRGEEETLFLPSLSPSASLLSNFVDELARKRLLRGLRCSDLLSRLMAYPLSKTHAALLALIWTLSRFSEIIHLPSTSSAQVWTIHHIW